MKRLAFEMLCRFFRGKKLVDDPSGWYMRRPLLWAYAGGGALRRYGNAAEDIDESIRLGFPVVEVDFARTSDGVPAMTHFFKPEDNLNEWDHIPSASEFKSKKVNGKYTPLLFDDFVRRYERSDVWFSLDPFYYYCNVRNGEREFRDYVVNHTTIAQRRRMILQLYSFMTLCQMRGNRDFGACHYVIGPGNFWKVKSILPLLTEAGVRSVSFQDCQFTDEVKNVVSQIKKMNIRVSVAGVETLERYLFLKSMGVDLVNTNKLTPAMLEKESL